MLKREWKKLLNNKLMLLVVVAVIAIPTIYKRFFLALCGIPMAMWISCRWLWSMKTDQWSMKGKN